MPQALPDRRVLTDVIPVVVEHALQQRAEDVLALLPVHDDVRLQRLRRHRVQPPVRRLGDLPPSLPHLIERWRARRRPVGELLVDVRQQHLLLSAVEPIPLLLPRQVPHVPRDAVHRQNASPRFLFRHALKPPPKFAPREPQLFD